MGLDFNNKWVNILMYKSLIAKNSRAIERMDGMTTRAPLANEKIPEDVSKVETRELKKSIDKLLGEIAETTKNAELPEGETDKKQEPEKKTADGKTNKEKLDVARTKAEALFGTAKAASDQEKIINRYPVWKKI